MICSSAVNFSHTSPSSLKECPRNAACLALSMDQQVICSMDPKVSTNVRLAVSFEKSTDGTITGLKIIFERWPVMLTGETNFSSVMSRF